MNAPQTQWITIAAANYLPFGRVLADSLRIHHGARLTLLLTDRDSAVRDDEPFDTWTLADVDPPAHWQQRYNRKGLAAALKPLAIHHALQSGADAVVFVDPDMWVLDGLADVEDRVRSATVTLTPHLLSPVPGPLGEEVERTVLISGLFNAGLVGVANCAEGHRFLSWWRSCVDIDCTMNFAHGVFYDQRWLDFVPSLFPGWAALRDPDLNVGWWRMVGRRLTEDDGRLVVDGRRCRLVHFSGFSADQPRIPSRYNTRFVSADDASGARDAFEHYARSLVAAGWNEDHGPVDHSDG